MGGSFNSVVKNYLITAADSYKYKKKYNRHTVGAGPCARPANSAFSSPRTQGPRSGWRLSPFDEGGWGDLRQRPRTQGPRSGWIAQQNVGANFMFARPYEAKGLDEVIRKNLEGLGYGG